MNATAVDNFHDRGRNIHAQDATTLRCKDGRRREADIAKAKDAEGVHVDMLKGLKLAHRLHPNTPAGDFLDLIEGDGRSEGLTRAGAQECGDQFGVAFATGGTA